MENTATGYLLSPLQKKAWDRSRAGDNYNNLLSIEVKGEVDKFKLSAALEQILRRHEIFRTTYLAQAHSRYPVQLINEDYKCYLSSEDISVYDATQQSARLINTQDNLISRAFNLETPGLLGAHSVKLSKRRYLLFLYSPAIASDVETLYNVAAELLELYGAEKEARDYEKKDPLQFVQYSEWQNELLEEANDDAWSHWRRKQSLNNVRTRLPFERFAKHKGITVPVSSKMKLKDTVSHALNKYAEQPGKSVSDFILTCWITLIWHHLGFPEDFLIGRAETGRITDVFKGINGLMTKKLPFHCKPLEQDTIDTLYGKTVEEVESNRRFQDSYEEAGMGAGQDLNVCYEVYRMGNSVIAREDIAFSLSSIHSHTDGFKLKLCLFEYADRKELAFHYDPAYFTGESIELIRGQMAGLLENALGDPASTLKNLMKVTGPETETILNDFNDTATGFIPATYIALFERQVEKTPGKTAIFFKDKGISYKELDEKANQVAAFLLSGLGVVRGDIIAVKLKRSTLLLTSILGIMKAGAAFLPIDNNTPEDRLAFILKDSGARFILTEEQFSSNDAEINAKVVVLDHSVDLQKYSSAAVMTARTPADIAYLIYTSGSTGKPKGTLIANSSFTNYLDWVQTAFKIDENDSTLLFSSVAFDLSYTSLWSSLISGSTLYILEETIYLEPDKLIATLIDMKITYIKLTPSHFSLIIEDPECEVNIPKYALRLIILGGEKINTTDIEKYIRLKNNTQFVNHYGPTETTIGVIAENIDTQYFEEFEQTPVIGKPLNNNQVYILNEENGLAPIGIIGEIGISGAGVAKGYLKREELTSAKFIPDPYKPGQVLYKTGDLGRWLVDGRIQLVGRNDSQVKIRGYRVETGEVEKVLIQQSNVQDAIVLAVSDDSDNLCLKAFLVGKLLQADITKLKESINAQLPEYMIPAAFTVLDKFPLLPNGKIDRKELLNLKMAVMENELDCILPKNKTEEIVAEIWKRILLKDVVSTNESFFNLGGNSLKLIKVFRELSKIFPRKLTVTELFKYSNIQAISEFLDHDDDMDKAVSDNAESIESFNF
jgi:amino acid adenylation domain-containing protein